MSKKLKYRYLTSVLCAWSACRLRIGNLVQSVPLKTIFFVFLFIFSFVNKSTAQKDSIYTTPGNYTFEVPSGVFEVTLQAWGGGASGGYKNKDARGGGGGGGYITNTYLTVNPGDIINIVVGAGGIIEGTTSIPGEDGEASSYNWNASGIATAGGGQIPNADKGGSGGVISGNYGSGSKVGRNGADRLGKKTQGGGGGGSGPTSANASGQTGGSPNGGSGGNTSAAGSDGVALGGGGGGKGGNNNSVQSGNGANGQIIISWILSTDPILSVGSLTDFGDVCPNSTAGPESFTITGSSLTTDNITIAALSGYTYSETSGGAYLNSLSFTQTGGSFSQQIFVKFTPTVVANYDGNIVIGGGGASDVNVAATGSGVGSSIPILGVANTVDCPNSTNGAIDLTLPYPIQFDDPALININTTLLSSRTTFTLEGWIKVDLSTIGNRISLFGQNDAIELGFSNSNTLMCWTNSGGSVSTGSYPSDNNWHHVAAVGNGTSIILYIDGVSVAAGGTPTNDYGNDTNFSSKIGAGVWDPDLTDGVFPGQMIKVGFWSTALSSGKIGNLASSYYYYTGSETGLLAGYNFFEGTGTSLGSATSDTDGTFSGSLTWQDIYTYAWTKSSDAGFSATTKNISGVGPGAYTVVVTNSSIACPNTDSWTINYLDNDPPTITCPADKDVSYNVSCQFVLEDYTGEATTNDNCDNDIEVTQSPIAGTTITDTTLVTLTATDDAGNASTCSFAINTTSPVPIDIAVTPLGNTCQSGETGSSTIVWNITKETGTDNWNYDYTIKNGSSNVVDSGTGSANGDTEISYSTVTNTPGVNQTFTLTIFNVKDNCGIAETDETNNANTTILYGVPNTGEITTDN